MSEAKQVVVVLVGRLACCSSKRQSAIQISCEVGTALRLGLLNKQGPAIVQQREG